MQNVRKLFLDPRPVSILAVAADTTQRAAGNQKMGGFFSYFFKSSVEANCIRSSVKPSWYTILEDTKTKQVVKPIAPIVIRPMCKPIFVIRPQFMK
ncbi:MAG: hypothetical protein HWD58_12290 [Bacteroidota bacterium]|nr:MAG: hypothetical protein HWD58_12290 [Bacteroidota bacterium]